MYHNIQSTPSTPQQPLPPHPTHTSRPDGLLQVNTDARHPLISARVLKGSGTSISLMQVAYFPMSYVNITGGTPGVLHPALIWYVLLIVPVTSPCYVQLLPVLIPYQL